jgi:U4/U6.U5 small nuclear ribonucleoproteins
VSDNKDGAAAGAVSKHKERKYRQYMNRKGDLLICSFLFCFAGAFFFAFFYCLFFCLLLFIYLFDYLSAVLKFC